MMITIKILHILKSYLNNLSPIENLEIFISMKKFKTFTRVTKNFG